MVKLVTLIGIAAFLAGCETPGRYDWVKEGATKYDRENAMSKCEYQIGLNKIEATKQNELLTKCMMGEGFRLKRIG